MVKSKFIKGVSIIVFVLASVWLISFYSFLLSFAKSVESQGSIICTGYDDDLITNSAKKITCCQNATELKGLEIRYCTDCDNNSILSNCGQPYEMKDDGNSNNDGIQTPLGNSDDKAPWSTQLHTQASSQPNSNTQEQVQNNGGIKKK
jgi:hypothetical protein